MSTTGKIPSVDEVITRFGLQGEVATTVRSLVALVEKNRNAPKDAPEPSILEIRGMREVFNSLPMEGMRALNYYLSTLVSEEEVRAMDRLLSDGNSPIN